MLLILGVLIIVAMLVFVCVAAWYKKVTATAIGTLAFVGVAVGIVVANLPNLAGLVLKSGDKTAYSLQLQKVEQKAQEVKTDADEVRQMKEQIEALVKRVEQGEQNVTAMQSNVRQAYQSQFQSLAYIVLTRNLFPPPKNILEEMERHVNLLAEFAYPDPQERAATIQRMVERAKAAQPETPQPPSPNTQPSQETK